MVPLAGFEPAAHGSGIGPGVRDGPRWDKMGGQSDDRGGNGMSSKTKWRVLAAVVVIVLLALLGAAVAVVGVTGLGLRWLLVGVAIAQWLTYVVTIRPFVSRGIVNSRLVLGSHLVHGSLSLAAFGCAFGCAELLAGAGLFVQALGEVVLTLAVCALVLRGRRWYPATRVLAERMSGDTFESGLLARLRVIVLG